MREVAWAVLVLAAAVKFWRLACLLRRLHAPEASRLERFRGALERRWAREGPAA